MQKSQKNRILDTLVQYKNSWVSVHRLSTMQSPMILNHTARIEELRKELDKSGYSILNYTRYKNGQKYSRYCLCDTITAQDKLDRIKSASFFYLSKIK